MSFSFPYQCFVHVHFPIQGQILYPKKKKKKLSFTQCTKSTDGGNYLRGTPKVLIGSQCEGG